MKRGQSTTLAVFLLTFWILYIIAVTTIAKNIIQVEDIPNPESEQGVIDTFRAIAKFQYRGTGVIASWIFYLLTLLSFLWIALLVARIS